MRIGIDARMYSTNFTGIGRYVYELIDNLLKQDKKNEYVLFMNRSGYDNFEPKSKRVKKVLVNARHYSFAEQTKFLFAIRKAKLDLMHFTHFNAPIFYRRPSVVTIHDLTLSFYQGKKMNSWFHRKAYNLVLRAAVKNAKEIIAVSQNTKQDLIDITHTSPSKIEVVYEGVGDTFGPREDKEALIELVKKYGINHSFMLYTGVWRSHKNLVNLIRAFALLKEDEGIESQLVITGEEDPYYPEVRRTVKEKGLEHDVIFTGLVDEDELVGLYQAAKLYVFPSLYEGFGLPPLEAMRCGTPVAASKSSCIPEICGEDNAMFFDPYDPEDMANSMRRVWLDEAMQKDLRERGLTHSRKFSWEKMADKTLAIYKKVLK
ncbi:glycosyltransferase family 4 protein [Candidatus Peregrinibacteria bacterium]|nr:glycosyltransferase family 4 protein [Candidatus Peregrinibacteria bacterium]MBT4631795.1 glycosyltransferase family 4 protein [Candidatus Peregrinibacteria bacterium]MBT5516858.1 glycosyltransferase family 4 protein [Candidatus Peregrinibacteria bacterium]